MIRTASTDALADVSSALDAYLRDRAAATPAAAALWAEVLRATQGGKMLRPRLLLAAHDALGGSDSLGAIRAAAAMELLHTAFLIHDDVIDRDWMRRGEPNVAAAFRSSAITRGARRDAAGHIGTSAAVIAGDLAIAGAVDLAWRASSDATASRAVAGIVADAVAVTAAGELADIELAARERGPLEAVLDMYEAKTSIDSFCAPLEAGAVLAGADDDLLRLLHAAGLDLGVAFQIADDLLGTFAPAEQSGKSTASDAREGKQTVLTALLAESDPAAAEHLRTTASDEEAFLRYYREVLTSSGARDEATRLISERTSRARRQLATTPSALQVVIDTLIDDLHERMR